MGDAEVDGEAAGASENGIHQAEGAGVTPQAQSKGEAAAGIQHQPLPSEDFRADGLRSYAMYRDLGMGKATNGLLQAHVIRLLPPCDPAVVSKRHYHDVKLQMIYVLKGWIKGEYDGQVVTMREGAAWLQPPRIKHTVLDYSDDCELLEMIVPADFKTVELKSLKNSTIKLVTDLSSSSEVAERDKHRSFSKSCRRASGVSVGA